jgi:hypothetical protein
MARINEVPRESVPEVAAFEEAAAQLAQFRAANQQVFDEYEERARDLNQKMQAADKVVRSKQVSCGSWEWYQTQVSYDADALYEALGREKFMQVGGKLQTTTKRSVDKTKVEAAIARKDIPQKVVEHIKKESPRYHAPKPIET